MNASLLLLTLNQMNENVILMNNNFKGIKYDLNYTLVSTNKMFEKNARNFFHRKKWFCSSKNRVK